MGNLKFNEDLIDEENFENEFNVTEDSFICWCYNDFEYDLKDIGEIDYCRINTEVKATFLGSMKVRRCLLDYCICDSTISKHKGKVIFKDQQEIHRLSIGHVGLRGSIKTNYLELKREFKINIDLDILDKRKKSFIIANDYNNKYSGKINMTSGFLKQMSENNKKLIYNDSKIEYFVNGKTIKEILSDDYLVSDENEFEQIAYKVREDFYTICEKQGLTNMYNLPEISS